MLPADIVTPCSAALPVDSKAPPLAVFNVPPVIVAPLLTVTRLAPPPLRLPVAVMFSPVLVTLVVIARVPPAVASRRSLLVTPPPFSASVLVPPVGVASITPPLISTRLPLPMTPVPWMVLFVLVRVWPLPSRKAEPPLVGLVDSVTVPPPLSVTEV